MLWVALVNASPSFVMPVQDASGCQPSLGRLNDGNLLFTDAKDTGGKRSMIRILGDDGIELASGMISRALDPVVLTVDRITSGKGRLLHYYFGQGRRHVVADLGDFRLRGNLRTRWQDGERRWEIRLRAATEASNNMDTARENVSPMT
jgi:hypothetical protein